MLVSIIIPVYNCKNNLEITVNSLLFSGLYDYEIVIIDDGSTDGSAEICDSLAEHHTNIRCIHQRNAGVSCARNAGIEEARGEYLLFFDADDTVDANALKHAADIIQEKNPDMLIFGISFDYYYKDRMYRRDDLVYPEERMMNKAQLGAEFVKLYESNAISTSCTKFIKREILMKNQVRYPNNLIEMEDFLFVVRCMQNCESIYTLPEVIYRYRQTENEKSTFNRILRIPSLTEYMKPFEEELKKFSGDISTSEKDKNKIEDIANRIYTVLFLEDIRFGNVAEIKRITKDMLEGKYADTISVSNPIVFQLLKNEKYYHVWMRGRKSHLRHWVAIRMKYMKSLWRK